MVGYRYMDRLKKLEKLGHPASQLWRGIEVKLLLQQFGGELARPGEALDLGCGEGVVARAIWDRPVVVGLDSDEKMVERARESGVYRWVIQRDGQKLPVADNSLDLVFSNSVLEHIKQVEMVLMEVARVLKPGGRLVMTTPSMNLTGYTRWGGWSPVRQAYGKWRDKKYHHYHLYDLAAWRRKLARVGLVVAKSYYYLTEAEVRLWDELLWEWTVSKLLGRNGQNRLYDWRYRQRVDEMVRAAKTTDETGASLAVMAIKQERGKR